MMHEMFARVVQYPRLDKNGRRLFSLNRVPALPRSLLKSPCVNGAVTFAHSDWDLAMGILLTLVAKIAEQYAFSAFALALLMLLSYWTLNNHRVLQIIDRALNTRLSQTALYRFLRLGVILVFVFSATVVVLSFLAPWLMRAAENDSLAMVLYADEKFKTKDYARAREGYAKALKLNPDQPGADQIRGMVTATYYGQALHEPGLQFICEQYRHRPQGERPFLFAVHAHLRALAVKNGSVYAEAAAAKFRRQCGRADFSEFWPHISFGMMENLRVGVLRAEHGWTVDPADQARLQELLRDKRRGTQVKLVPHADFVLYFLDRFDELIQDIPQSSLRDSALFDAVRLRSSERDVDYLKMLVSQYPDSPHYIGALRELVRRLARDGALDEALRYVAVLRGKEALDAAADDALGLTFDALSVLIASGDIQSALKLSSEVCAKFKPLRLPCNQRLVDEQAKLQRAQGIIGAAPPAQRCLPVYQRLRPLIRVDEDELSKTWARGVRAFLVACLPALSEGLPDDYAKALYSIGSVSRLISDYETSFEYLQRFEREIAEHELKDDVLVELGYHKLVVQDDWPAAAKYLNRVISEYPDRNAYDNALWWTAKGLQRQGDYAGALAAYTQIAAAEVAGRFRAWSGIEAKRLAYFSQFAPFQGVALRNAGVNEPGGMFVAKVSEDSPMAKILAKGDRLVAVCDQHAHTLGHVLTTVGALRSDDACKILYLRQNVLLKVSGSLSAGWNATRTSLSDEQIDELAVDPATF